MLFGKKKKKEHLPDLPSGRFDFDMEQGSDYSYDSQNNMLPSFPDKPAHNKFSQEAIKSAVDDEEAAKSAQAGYQPAQPQQSAGEMEEIGEKDNNNIKIVEMEEWRPSVTSQQEEKMPLPGETVVERSRRSTAPVLESGTETGNLESVNMPKKPSDIFVKLEKFNSAKKALNDAKSKLDEIDELLRRIRDTKLKEEQELVAWERNLEHVKSRMQNVTANIFEKAE